MDSDESLFSQETVTIFEAEEEIESSEEPPMHEWSSLDLVIPEVNEKKILYAQGLYEPGSGEICAKCTNSNSHTSILHHLYYNYPAVTDPGIQEALLLPEKPVIYPEDGQELYIAMCKEMDQTVVRPFLRCLLSEEIDLSYYCVDIKGIRPMAMALTNNNKVKILNLTDNFLSDDACYHLGEMLVYNSNLKELNMSRCRIKSTGVQRLLRGMARNRTLRTLNLNRNDLGDDGAGHIAKAVHQGLNVEELYLSYNNIGARGTSVLAEGFETHNSIIKLDLSWNSLTAPVPTYCLLAKLGESDTLQEINLSWNALAGPRIGIGIRLLLKAPNLKYLNLSNNALSGEAITNCIGNIAKSGNLITLDLSFNPLTPSDALSVLKKMKFARVENLLLENVNVTSKFLEVLKEVNNIKTKQTFFLTYGRVIDSFRSLGPDIKELVLKRADYLTKRSKKNEVDLALIILKLVKDNVERITEKDFTSLIRATGARLDSDLINTMVAVFASPGSPKNGKIDLMLMADYVKRLWPEKKLPPTPPPEPVAEPATGKKPKRKQKFQRKKQAVRSNISGF